MPFIINIQWLFGPLVDKKPPWQTVMVNQDKLRCGHRFRGGLLCHRGAS
jgi:hypothetical protein